MKLLRWILLPFALLYGAIVAVRNRMFDWGLLSQYPVPIPSVGVGNLAVGGTGKSVVVAYLAGHFKSQKKVGMISRGYGRSTSGVRLASAEDTAQTIGDEALQLLSQHPEISIAVAEQRTAGIQQLLAAFPNLEVLLFDDCFQHRYIRPSHMLLTTAYNRPYFNDVVLPVGRLREAASAAVRAHIIVVTKCPPTLSTKAREEFKAKLQLQPQQEVVFTTYTYDTNVYSKKEQLEVSALTAAPILLVTGIADPLPLCEALKAQGIAFEHKSFSDHHNFSTQEVSQLKSAAVKRKVLTTEKDFMRLAPLWGEEANLFYWPIQLGFVTPADEQLIQDWLATVK